VFVKIKVI